MEAVRIDLADNQVGTLNEDGSYQEWPELDIFGKPYQRENATVRRLDTRHFVAIPPKRDGDHLEFVRPGSIASALVAPEVTTEPPAFPTEALSGDDLISRRNKRADRP